MSSVDNLDILVVYSSTFAQSASVDDDVSLFPFLPESKQSNYNLSYRYFLEECERLGKKAGFTASQDIIGSSKCQNYWTYAESGWKKVDNRAHSFSIYEKLSPIGELRTEERDLLSSSDEVSLFNDEDLFQLFFDKEATHARLTQFAIPTVAIHQENTKSITTALNELQVLLASHSHADDFTQEIILKDRFGSGGFEVYKIAENIPKTIEKIMKKNTEVSFIIQPCLLFDQGFLYNNRRAATDIRLIFNQNNLIQSYLRIAKDDNFLCNEHQGGQLIYAKSTVIPEIIHQASRQILKKINKPYSLFALDFAISNSGRVYLIEGNIGPGIDWDVTKKTNEVMSKQLIRTIVETMVSRIDSQASN